MKNWENIYLCRYSQPMQYLPAIYLGKKKWNKFWIPHPENSFTRTIPCVASYLSFFISLATIINIQIAFSGLSLVTTTAWFAATSFVFPRSPTSRISEVGSRHCNKAYGKDQYGDNRTPCSKSQTQTKTSMWYIVNILLKGFWVIPWFIAYFFQTFHRWKKLCN